jgi:hypothetical protein
VVEEGDPVSQYRAIAPRGAGTLLAVPAIGTVAAAATGFAALVPPGGMLHPRRGCHRLRVSRRKALADPAERRRRHALGPGHQPHVQRLRNPAGVRRVTVVCFPISTRCSVDCDIPVAPSRARWDNPA